MHPFECSACRVRIYENVKPLTCPNCKKEKTLGALVKICLLVSANDFPNLPVVHRSGETGNIELKAPTGKAWATACGASTKPPFVTAHIAACTCKRCMDSYAKFQESKNDSVPVPSQEVWGHGGETTIEEVDDETYGIEDADGD